jgi:hypothetical protein
MQERTGIKGFLPIIFVFIALNSFAITAKNMLQRWNADQEVLIYGNLALFIITLISFAIARKGLGNKNPHAFVRAVYGSILLKLFLCLILAFIYIAVYRSALNKPALFACMGLYLVYTTFEVLALMKLLKVKSNG